MWAAASINIANLGSETAEKHVSSKLPSIGAHSAAGMHRLDHFLRVLGPQGRLSAARQPATSEIGLPLALRSSRARPAIR